MDWSDWEPKYREPRENYRISRRCGRSEPDTKTPDSGLSCTDLSHQYNQCLWGDEDRNKNYGGFCEKIIKKNKCPRGCAIFRTIPELKDAIESTTREILTSKKNLKKLKSDLQTQQQTGEQV